VGTEHAMPLWTGKVIPGSGPWVHRHADRHRDEPIREWSKDVPDLKCNAACQHCNEGWMSQLEDRAKPILTPLILGRSTRLELHDLETVCFWAIKTSLMLDRCSDADRQNVPASVYAELYKAQTVLPSTHLWIGRADVSRGSWFQARTLELDSGDATTPGFGTTVWVGYVVFHVIAVSLVGPVKLGLKEDVLEDMAPIWPRSFKFDWPATRAMTLDQVVDLGERIADSGLRIYPR
jgi:hypothetical protein